VTLPAKLTIVPLGESHDRTGFESGVALLDRYFLSQVGQDIRRRVASCFVVVEDGGLSPIGFYTLAATGLRLDELPEAITKRLPRYPIVPAALMGRLAVDRRHRRTGLGEALLLDAFSRALRSDLVAYAFVVDAKDDFAGAFYSRYGFRRLTTDGLRLFMPMAEIAKLFA
jgi:GNAT superfamily N-acetyltransferase